VTEALSAVSADALSSAPVRAPWRRMLRRWGFWIPASVLALLMLIALFPAPFAWIFGNGDPRVCDVGKSLEGPQAGHPFGFDVQGCDVYANVIYGTQSSMAVGVLTTVLALTIAIVLGVLAGLGARWIDWSVSRLTDIFLGFPFLLGAIVMLTVIGTRNVLSVSIVLAIFGWPTMARLMRGSVRSVRNQDYVLAARTMGLPSWRVVWRYVLPNSIAPVLVIATIAVGSVIVAESSLTYLGVGLQPPAISWGLQLASASTKFQLAPHLLIFPGLFLAATVLSIISLGDTLRATLDPRRQQ
jgi:ABC-type dipeptide/oligopeptide/nickel transport system permease subunit